MDNVRMVRSALTVAVALLLAACTPLPTASVWPNPSPAPSADAQAILDEIIARDSVDFDDGFCDLTNVRVSIENYVTDATIYVNEALEVLTTSITQGSVDRVRRRGQELVDAATVRALFYELLRDLVGGQLAGGTADPSASPGPSATPSAQPLPPDETAVLEAIGTMLTANERYNLKVGQLAVGFTSAEQFEMDFKAATEDPETLAAVQGVDAAWDAIIAYEDKRCWNRETVEVDPSPSPSPSA